MANKILVAIAREIGMSKTQLVGFAGHLVVAILIWIIGFKVIKYIVKATERIFEKSNIDLTLRSFFISFLKIALKILVIFMAVSELGVATSSIIAMLGSAGLALGLSLQGSLTNIAGGVILLFIKPFQVGDYIIEESSGKEGTVLAIGIMYTKLMTTDNQVVFVPNGNLSNTSITNITAQEKRMVQILVCVDYKEDIRNVVSILKDIINKEKAILKDENNRVYVNEFKDTGTEVGVRFWVKSEEFWDLKWHIMEKIKIEFENHQIQFSTRNLAINMEQKSEIDG